MRARCEPVRKKQREDIMQEVQELNEQEIAATAGAANWMDYLAAAVNCAEVTMYNLTHPD